MDTMMLAFCLVGLALGSFSNVVVWRFPKQKTLFGRSVCNVCGRVLAVLDLIPVLNTLLLRRGRARCCGAWIGFSYTFWELVTVLLFYGALHVSPTVLEAALLAGCFWFLLCIARIDAHTQMIPDALNIPFILLAGTLAAVRGTSPLAAVLLLLFVFGGQWLVSRGRWIGSGDVLLAVGIGMLVGHIVFAVLVVMVAYMVGAAWALSLLLQKKVKLGQMISFGPFLCVAAVVVSMWADVLLRWTGFYA